MAVITRWSHKRGGRKAGFHCIFDRNRNLFFWKSEFVYVNWNLFSRIGSKTNSDFRKQLRFSNSFSKTNSDFRRQTPVFEKQTSGGVHPYISFGHKTGIDCPFRSGITGVYERIYRFNSKWVRKKEEYSNSKGNLRNLFCFCSNLSNDDIIILRCQVWKRVWILQARSESRWEKWYHLVWNRVRIWRTRQHTSTKDSQEYPLPHRIQIGSQCRLHEFRKANP